MDFKSIDVILKKMAEEIKIIFRENIVSLPSFQVVIPTHIQKRRDEMEQEYLKHGFNPPETQELSGMEKDPKGIRQIIAALHSAGRLKTVDASHYIHVDCLREALERLEAYLINNGSITLAEYRDLLETSRKPAMRILEHADNKKITLLEEGARTLLIKPDHKST